MDGAGDFAIPFDVTQKTALKTLPFVHERWPVLYIDNHLLAVYKPAGLLVQGDPTGDPCLLDLAKMWIKERFHKPGNVFLGLVHRLDRPVSGLVLLARTSKAAGRLSALFREKRVEKIYLAVVEGCPKKASDTLIHGLARLETGGVVVHPEGASGTQRAVLHYRTVETRGGRSLLAVRLETGRKHQIRAQLAHVGCPIVGDVRYGASAALAHRAVALHAWIMRLEHPTRKEPLEILCPVPVGWPWPLKNPDEPPGHEASRPLWHWRDYHWHAPSL
ncbi:RluA family pseudouridine synthase [Desulfosoma sp.]